MELPKTYNPNAIEDKWYKFWMDNNFFKSTPDEREPYTIVIPPPNVTGVLHMGHMLNNTIQDVLIRRARMLGKNACWVPGTDHASIATEAKVVAMLKEKGIEKSALTRDQFLTHAWEWKEKYGGIILEQLKKLGASCDWDRTRFTMEENLSEAVIDVFIDLHNKGLIYRGTRMVNWDPTGLTAVSDEEVIHKEVNSKLFYVNYQIEGSNDFITIATTRPETILGDTAICVHPEDKRFKHLHGKKAIVPIANRMIPIICDDYIDMEFGTGALKVTPAHDINDYNLGLKHHLEVIDILTPEGKIAAIAGHYIGEDRFTVRKKIALELDALGHLVKTEEIKNKVGYSERTNSVIEPRLSLQWFLKMEELAKPALENVLNEEIKFIPNKFINTYKHWMENVRDWCISRQLWWGQRIPAWYDASGNFVVAKTRQEAEQLLKTTAIKQDEDVLDTWFSSWLWPISVFDGFKNPENLDISYYYPTNDLITAPEILFFWVARMIIAGYEYTGKKPFSNVYLTGIVRDKLGRKMSKSLGNSPNPLDLIDKYGADGVRIGMLLASPAGNDLLFDESLCEQGRNFSNKLWNAFRLIKGWEVDATLKTSDANKTAMEWFDARFNQQLELINDNYTKYRMSDVLMLQYKLVWDDFCAWYLEIVKPAYINGVSTCIDLYTYNATIQFLESLVKVLHPYMPFITEEIWHLISERPDQKCLIVEKWPTVMQSDSRLLQQFSLNSEIIMGIRNVRNSKNISPKEVLQVSVKGEIDASNELWTEIVKKLANTESIQMVEKQPENSIAFVVKNIECYVLLGGLINQEKERETILKELEYTRGFLKSVNSKLANANFIAKAKPELIENERKKQVDASHRINLLEEQLKQIE